MTITASDVNRLRKQTGAGMMDCKKALTEAEGDFEKAIDILRKKGQKVAAKRSDREAGEGLVIAKTNDNKTGVLVMLNCETDFVAKNEEFGALANEIVDMALQNEVSNADELKSLKMSNGLTISEKITEEIGKIGEKIDLGGFEKINSEYIYAYNHPGNRLASMVGMNQNSDEVEDAGKNVAMQVAAMNPVALDKDSVSQDVIDRELAVGKEQALNEGKPENMVEKIAQGKLNKFFKENTLLNQDYIKESKQSVQNYLKSVHPDLRITEYKRLALS